MPNDKPSAAATLERAHSFANEAIHAVALQRKRLRYARFDQAFPCKQWVDWKFLIVALWRLRLAAKIAAKVPGAKRNIDAAIAEFDKAIPGLRVMRDADEHVDAYAVDAGFNKAVTRRHLQVSQGVGRKSFAWLGHVLDADTALNAAEKLYSAIQRSMRIRPGARSPDVESLSK